MCGLYWKNVQILVKCDNMAVVNILSISTSKDPLVMHLLQTCILFVHSIAFS